MAMKLLSADDFRSAAKNGEQPEGITYKFATGDAENIEGAARTKRFVFSDATVDHSGDSIDPKGWDLGVFNRNPVALFSHASWDPPIGRASNVAVNKGKLTGDIEFASADVYDFADTIFRLVDGGFLKAVSVGFMPKTWAFSSDKDRPYGIDFKSQQLLEISVCSVPCNPAALSEARSIGIDTAPLREWAEKVLDSGDTMVLPRKEVETLREQAAIIGLSKYYLQASTTATPEQAEAARENVKRWQDDQSEILVLGEGMTLRAVGDDGTLGTGEAISSKAGRRVSAATKAKLQEAMGHHEAAGKCMTEAMGTDDDGGDADDPDADAAVQDAANPTVQPPGTMVPETVTHLSPEETRLKEVRDLRAGLPATN